MPKSLLQLLNEAPPAMPMGGGLGGPGGPGPLGAPMGGGLPPPPPMGGGMGGGLPPPPLGGPGGMGGPGDPSGMQPVPVKTIDVMDVWEVLRHAAKDMDKHQELNVNYERKKSKGEIKKFKSVKKSALMT